MFSTRSLRSITPSQRHMELIITLASILSPQCACHVWSYQLSVPKHQVHGGRARNKNCFGQAIALYEWGTAWRGPEDGQRLRHGSVCFGSSQMCSYKQMTDYLQGTFVVSIWTLQKSMRITGLQYSLGTQLKDVECCTYNGVQDHSPTSVVYTVLYDPGNEPI